jgi:hypothetical protein
MEEGDTRVDTFAYELEDDDGSVVKGIVNITIKGYTPDVSASPVPSSYTISLSGTPVNAGSVSVSPARGSYTENTEITLKAVAARGFEFDHWSGDLTSDASTLTMLVNANMSAVANFVPATIEAFSEGGTLPAALSSGTASAGTLTQTGTESGGNGDDGMNLWVVMGPLLGVAAIIAIARIERMGGFGGIRKSWNRAKTDLD